MSNIKKFLIFLSILIIAVTASAHHSKTKTYPQQFYFTVLTPNASFKVLNTSTPNPLWIYGETPTCADFVCTYGIQDGIDGYQFSVTIGSDPQHACNIIVQTFPYKLTQHVNLLAASSCNGGLTYKQVKNINVLLVVDIYSNQSSSKSN